MSALQAFFFATRNKPVRADISVKNNTYPVSSSGGTTLKGHTRAIIYAHPSLYVFYFFIGALAIEYHIREDKPVKYGRKDGAGDQLPHFNSGKHPGKKKDHRYWKK